MKATTFINTNAVRIALNLPPLIWVSGLIVFTEHSHTFKRVRGGTELRFVNIRMVVVKDQCSPE